MWKKVIAPAILVSLLWIAGSSITTHYIHQVYESHSQVLDENVATIQAGWAMQETLWQLQAVVMEVAGKERRETRIETEELAADFQRHLDAAESTSYTPEEEALVKAAGKHFAIYRDHIAASLEPPGLADLLTSQAAEKEKTLRLARAVADPCRQLVEINERILDECRARSARLSGVVNSVRLAFLISGPLLGVLFGLRIARGLRHSISQISVTLNDATGDMDRQLGSVEVRSLADLPGLHQQVQAVAGRIRQVMDELQHTRRQAMLAERLAAVGELAAGIAHELRNPLTSVKLLIQTAQRQVRDQPAGKQLQVAQREIGRLESTIQGLLDFARPPELRRVLHDLRKTVQRALNLVDGRAKQQGVAITNAFPDTPVTVDGDPELLHQIFVNLLLNGIEAMPQGGNLHIAMHEADVACCVSVSDSGSGIPQQVLKRIFEPFVTSKERGTGLGLAISHRIAREHGGTLLAANRDHGGAVFTLELPLRKAGTDARRVGDGQEAVVRMESLAALAHNDSGAVDVQTSGN
jgi:signal transduction histidine kinase